MLFFVFRIRRDKSQNADGLFLGKTGAFGEVARFILAPIGQQSGDTFDTKPVQLINCA